MRTPLPPRANGFTLIELLVVVGLIAILAAIAISNLLGAQIRSKVSRTQADLRATSVALESYAVDAGSYPGNFDGVGALSTPIAYIENPLSLRDPFGKDRGNGIANDYLYLYANLEGFPADLLLLSVFPDSIDRSRIAGQRWLLLGRGPDEEVESQDPTAGYVTTGPMFAAFLSRLADGTLAYDPTNGAVSDGDIIRGHAGPITQAVLRPDSI